MEKESAISLPVELKSVAQTMVFMGLSVAAFFAPFLIGHPQWLVGTIVNTGLFLSAIFLPKRYILPAIIFPSLGVLARGIVFGPFTPFLAYFLPFIWLGNLILILVFKRAGFVAGALAKFLFLFLIASIYVELNFAPAVFLQAMGLNQLATAMAGGLLALLILKVYGKSVTRS